MDLGFGRLETPRDEGQNPGPLGWGGVGCPQHWNLDGSEKGIFSVV